MIRSYIFRWLVLGAVVLLGAAPAPRHSHYLFVWATEVRHPGASTSAGSVMRKDFLAVFDVAPTASPFGKLVAMLPVEGSAEMAHHSNYALPPNNVLFANDWMADRSYVFDLHDPASPRLISQVSDAGSYMYPHSFVYLSNGNTLATFQYAGGFNHAPGGIVELDGQGRVVRRAPRRMQRLMQIFGRTAWPSSKARPRSDEQCGHDGSTDQPRRASLEALRSEATQDDHTTQTPRLV